MTPELQSYLDSDPGFVPLVRLIFFDFLSGPVRLAESETPVEAGGVTWQPHYGLVNTGSLQITNNPFDANPAKYTCWSVGNKEGEDLAFQALNNPEQWYGRRVTQSFTVRGFPNDNIVIHAGVMRKVVPEESEGLNQIVVHAESIAAKRNFTPLGEYTPRDQARRYPGVADRAFDYVSSLPGKVIQGWLVG